MATMKEPVELGRATTVSVEAIGVPGRRRFRVMAVGERGGAVCLWLEKEQLAALGEALRQALANRPGAVAADDDGVFPAIWACEFKAGQLSLAMDQSEEQFVLKGEPLLPEEDVPASCSFAFSFAQARALVPKIAQILAAGRPPCPLCSAPIDPEGHVCVRSNGHHPR